MIFKSIHNIYETFYSDSRVFENTIEMNEADVLKMWVAINFRDDIDESSDDIRSQRFTGGCGIIKDESLLIWTGEHP